MKISLEVPDHKAAFILEVLQAFSYVKATPVRSRTADKSQDETAYLLSTENNRRELMESIAQLDRGEGEAHDLID